MTLREKYDRLLSLEKEKRKIEKRSAIRGGHYLTSDEKKALWGINKKIDALIEGEVTIVVAQTIFTQND